MFIEFQGWYPDAAPTTPGVLIDGSNNLVPTNKGYRGANDWSAVQVESLTATAVGLFYARRLDGSNRLLAGTSTQLWERGGSTWTSRIPAAITVSAVSRWRFAQYGNITLAGSKDTQPLQFETTTATTIAAMPRYDIIDTVLGFVMIGNVITSVTFSNSQNVKVQPGEHPDRWWCSALDAYDSWTPSLETQAASGRLLDTPGPLTAGKKIGDRFVFYKQRGMWLGSYVGLPFVWEWTPVTSEIGTWGQDCVVPVEQQHYFIGADNIYVFDGSQVRPIGEGVREWFFGRLQKPLASKILGAHDQINSLVYWWYPGPESTGTLTEFIVFNYETGKWGRGTSTIQAAHSFKVDQLTWDELWVGYTFDTVPNTTFDSIWFQADSYVPVFINGDKKLATLHGPHLDSTLETSWTGDDVRTSLLRRVRARWVQAPDSAILTPYRLMRQGEIGEVGTPRTMTYARWDFTQVARWHRVRITTSGDWETAGIDAEAVPRGRE